MAELTDWLQRCPLVAILRGVRPDEIEAIGTVLVDSGFAIIEVPLNSPEPIASIRRLVERFGEHALIGAGTVTGGRQIADIAGAGGRLVVMPHGDPAIIRRCKAAGLIALPGFATLTEAFAALAAGADGLKLFPAEASPPAVLKAMKAVLPPAVPVLPVGGIAPEKMAAYWQAGARGFGLGSALYAPGMTADAVRGRAEAFIAEIRKLQG
ncbi:MAG TPA: 2-dehydro-3-deoxy-6-phosphogalactonate aldolase [Stellaceae bacterium]|jgi:2-dehydro-3-deoxyphosphogalactonate aldolase|nr:2-dehydro-3-deoxy-6-phosphogalactonate aldolase [Stellaceae bacterium]